MDFEANSLEISQILKRFWLPIGLGCIGLIFFIYGLISFLGTSKTNTVPFSQEKTASNTPNLISVDIEGAVVNPGVYKLPFGSIVQDALILSKGLSEEADREYVAKNINLAAKVSDGEKIYIPKIGEQVLQTQNVDGASTSQTGLININTATESQLDSLPGVGHVTAGKIISGRPYSSIEDLLNKKIVTSKVYSEIKDKVSVY